MYTENTSDKWYIPWYTTRKRCMTILYHAIENTVANNQFDVHADFILNGFELASYCLRSRQHLCVVGSWKWRRLLDFSGNKIAAHNGKVGCNTVEYTTAFLYFEWLYFPWHCTKYYIVLSNSSHRNLLRFPGVLPSYIPIFRLFSLCLPLFMTNFLEPYFHPWK